MTMKTYGTFQTVLPVLMASTYALNVPKKLARNITIIKDFSVVLQALVDAHYKFLVWMLEPMVGKVTVHMEIGSFPFPQPRQIPGSTMTYLTLSLWRCLKTELQVELHHVDKLVLTACLLHNILIDKEGLDEGVLQKIDSTNIVDNARCYNRAGRDTYYIRDQFKILFNTVGATDFQDHQIDTYKKRITRRYWVHEINQKRSMCGEYHTLYPDLLQDNERFHMYFRVTKTQFEEIHEFIQSDIHKKDTTFRRAISTKERLAICLRFLATGSSFRSLGFNYRMGFSTVREIVQDVCDAIWKKMGPIHMPKPTTAMWEESENGFRNYWNFPNCCGALDGKHVIITCPINSGSNYWNYKGTNSIVLLALVDPKYRFLVIDVGSYGKNSDGGIFENSILGKLIQDGKLKFPGPKPLTLNSEPLPHVIVADEAFPLKPFLMRPYSKNDVCNNEPNKVFNYRLTRARRIVENAFGILRSRWRVFAGPMAVQPDMVDKIILATCCLHNYLGTDNLPSDCDDSLQANLTESTAFNHLNPIRRNSTQYAFSVRNKFKEYFSTEGAVPWQLDIMSQEECAAAFVVIYRNKKKKRKNIWVKEWLQKRSILSHIQLIKELRNSSENDLKNYLRMNEECFQLLLSSIKPHITKKDTVMRESISAEERLLVTLRYLATGRSMEDLKFSAIISPQALGNIIPETCKYIYLVLKDEYLKFPKDVHEWQEVARDFLNRWNFPNCGGAIDGKHIRIVKPKNSGSYYFNYKEYCSIVLLAVVNANYEFVYINVGCNG
nr:unnamed protein product [Callosobruchus analis]